MARGKKNARRRHATIVFLDESGFSERPSIRRTWAPRGCTPVLRHRQRSWSQLSAIGAVAANPGQCGARPFLMFKPGTVRSPDLVRFLRHLHRHIEGHVLLLWDGLNVHRSAETRAYITAQSDWLTVNRLPAYAPELNPVEALWAWLKGTAVPNLCPENIRVLHHALSNARRRVRRRPALVRAFFRKAGLSI
jgi:transposase